MLRDIDLGYAYDRRMARLEDARADADVSRGAIANCGDRTCGGPDCRACYPGTLGACRVCHGLIESECDCDTEDA